MEEIAGALILERVFNAVHHIAARRHGEYPKVFHLNKDKYWALVQHVHSLGFVQWEGRGDRQFVFLTISISLKRERKAGAAEVVGGDDGSDD